MLKTMNRWMIIVLLAFHVPVVAYADREFLGKVSIGSDITFSNSSSDLLYGELSGSWKFSDNPDAFYGHTVTVSGFGTDEQVRYGAEVGWDLWGGVPIIDRRRVVEDSHKKEILTNGPRWFGHIGPAVGFDRYDDFIGNTASTSSTENYLALSGGLGAGIPVSGKPLLLAIDVRNEWLDSDLYEAELSVEYHHREEKIVYQSRMGYLHLPGDREKIIAVGLSKGFEPKKYFKPQFNFEFGHRWRDDDSSYFLGLTFEAFFDDEPGFVGPYSSRGRPRRGYR